MQFYMIILIISFSVWLISEGILMLRDRKNAKGSTTADKRTRSLNFLATVISVLSPAFIWLTPFLNIGKKEIFILTLAGILFMLGGFALRYWSIHVLGKYFRTTVEIEEKQPVIQKGPYRFIRHPSYSGIILFFVGYGVLSQNFLSLFICLLLPVTVLSYRIRIEEKEFIEKAGSAYIEYQTKTKKLIPWIW